MEFDEYEYLERIVKSPEHEKVKENGNSRYGGMKSEEKHKRKSNGSREKKDDSDDSGRSKRAKSGDELNGRDQRKERGSSRHHSVSRDGERDWKRNDNREWKDKNLDDERNREERNGNHRVRNWEQNKRDYGYDHEKDTEREGERSRRSRSQSERYQRTPDGRDRDKSREKEFRERDRDRGRDIREHDRESRRHKEKKVEGSEPQVDQERDQRTVFAYQLSLRASESDIFEFFSRAGKVRDVRLIMDRISKRSKGVGYVEFYDAMSVPMAIALSGEFIFDQQVMVKPSESEKNLVQSTSSAAGGSGGQLASNSGGGRRLYVGNLHYNVTEDKLRQVFEAFGTVVLAQLPLDETGCCKGFGFVQFARLEDAKSALNMNGEDIAGHPIKVKTVTDQAGMHYVESNTGDLDDDEGGGGMLQTLNSHSRAFLMQKLDQSGNASSIGSTTGGSSLVPPSIQASILALSGVKGLQLPAINVPTIDTIGVPSECLLLKNMFDPKLETEPDFDLEVREDAREECSKYGNLKHMHVDKESDGFVYLRFENTQSAVSAQHNLHGRWFAGKMITATFMVPETYQHKFPGSNM